MAGKRKAGSPRKAAAAPKPRWRRVVRKVLVWGTVTGLVLALIAVGAFVYLYQTIDIPDPNEEFQTETSFVYYDGGEDELGRYATQDRVSISLDQMPDSIKDAVVAAENRSFYSDNGIDPKGILRAAFSNASGGSTQGASTITQQYVKLLYLSQERSYTRKVKEAILSLKVQRQQSKAQVLEGYLNTVYFGRGAYGIEAAANAFFKRSAADLNLRQSAVLAAVVNNPTRFDPDNGADARQALRGRYAYVLGSMADIDAITNAEASQADQRLPKFPKIKAESAYGGQRGHELALVRSELQRLGFGEDQIDGGGLRVTTTLTQRAMEAAEEGIEEVRPDVPRPQQLHMAAASVEPGTGAVRGFYAGQDYLDSELNWAVEGGQAGSTFKAFAVAAALQDGFSLNSTFDGDSPITLPDGTDFENQGDDDYGTVSLLEATEDSINTAFIDLTNTLGDGPQKIIDAAVDMGIPPEAGTRDGSGFPSRTRGLEPILGVALGSQTVSPINMANGYATIASGGVAAEPYLIERVESRTGEELYSHETVTDRAISEDVASDVSYALQQVVEGGSGTAALELDRPAAGKTGTATREPDNAVSSSWFTGFTPQLSTSVMMVRGRGQGQLDGWVPASSDGRDGYFGGNYPAKAWTAIMGRDLDGAPVEEFPEPAFVDEDRDDDSTFSDDDGSDDDYVPPAPEPSQPTRPPQQAPPTREPSPEPSPSQPSPTQPSPTEPTDPSTPSPGDPGDPIPVPDPGQGGGNGGGGGGNPGGNPGGGGGSGGGGSGPGGGGGGNPGGGGGGGAGTNGRAGLPERAGRAAYPVGVR